MSNETEKEKRKFRGLKFQKFTNVEYASITRNRETILDIPAVDLEGKTHRDLQIYLGQKGIIGNCRFYIKFKNNPQPYQGQTKGVNPGMEIKQGTSDVELKKLQSSFDSLKKELSIATQSGGITFDMLLNSTKQGYEANITFLNQQISYKDGIIQEQKLEIKNLNDEIDDLDDKIAELQRNSGYMQYLDPVAKMLMLKFGKGSPVKLEESDPSGIPKEVLQVLGVIDYERIEPQHLQQMIGLLQNYISISKLPLKGQ